ncbi:glutathione S-transferase family protein [Gallaecimonas sp. GXIMD4217]|uniref:glutathione S-transferase family protein n=1 Tax=Gallaecimonas sp. GXIMD4217 TaxID=3131927 RepID=UPI00311AEF5B
MTERKLILFHSPQTRSSSALALLEELGVPFELKVLNIKAGENRQPGYLAVNPQGKVPALLDGEVLVTDRVAIFLHLADLFPEAGLAPALDDPQRGAYVHWLVHYGCSFEPAVVDHYLARPAMPISVSPYGDFDTVLRLISERLAKGPYLLGERFSAADLLWGMSLHYVTEFGLVPRSEVFDRYIERIMSRPSVLKIMAEDAERAAEQQQALDKAG